ncbi:amidohydrolase family protein [Millisia brevis]|uniref:amidohydrolase family protein n=1 Tax=Millisia brevis TaxID=264148 RepID=UPI001C3F4D12|nr:amidohydrolase family protein [Millisia brevis]
MKRFPHPVTGQPVEAAPVVDCHQHLWPPALIEALRARSSAPRMVGWDLYLDGEPVYRVRPEDHDPAARAAIDADDDIDDVLYSLSCPLGIESLPPEQAAPLLDAWHHLADDLAPTATGHGIWAAAGLVEPDPKHLAAVLEHPRVRGLQIPSGAIADPAALDHLAPLLAVVEEADLPVLVHPGPAAGARDVPGWWPALTAYPAGMAAAWFAWHVAGRALLPALRIAFVALAGLAPLHHERLDQRGGTFGRIDPHVYYETSSYGPRAIDAMVRVVGVDPIVHGSDRPYALPTDPGLGDAFSRALFVTNPAHLLHGGSR